MNPDYECLANVKLSGGDVWITVSGDEQTFIFSSGLGFVILPNLFSVLTTFYKGESRSAKLDCHGNFDYYNFTIDRTNIRIEHIGHYPEGKTLYTFNLYKYLVAVDKGFREYLEKLHREGILPLQFEEIGHPLGKGVMEAYQKFSLCIKK